MAGSDDFESYNFHTGVDNGRVLAWSITNLKSATEGVVTYTPTGVFYGVESLTMDAPFLTSQYILWQEGGQFPRGSNDLVVQFPSLVHALAFDFGMALGEAPSFDISLDNGQAFHAGAVHGGWSFFGFISDQPFQTVTLTAGLYPVIDNLAWGNAVAHVPEPTSLALLWLALGITSVTSCGRRKSLLGREEI